jgi:lambda repressor-like predicted transcriptional regulator
VITHDGETLSIKSWAARIGLSPETLRFRLARGWSIERAFDPRNRRDGGRCALPGRPNERTVPGVAASAPTYRAGTPLTYEGTTQTVAAWARSRGMSSNLLEVRLARGWSIARALTTPAERRAHGGATP